MPRESFLPLPSATGYAARASRQGTQTEPDISYIPGVILREQIGRVLVVHPTYKDVWEAPGRNRRAGRVSDGRLHSRDPGRTGLVGVRGCAAVCRLGASEPAETEEAPGPG